MLDVRRLHTLRELAGRRTIAATVCHRSADWSVVLQMVAGRLGVALVPRLASGAAPEGAVIRPLAPPAPARQLLAATRTGADQHPAVKHVLASLVSVVRAGRG